MTLPPLGTPSFYKYKSKYSGMEMSDVATMRSLEDENAKLKRMLASMMRKRWGGRPPAASNVPR